MFFLCSIFLPWWIGFLIVRMFLKKGKGEFAFSVGSGYILGWFIATCLLRLQGYFSRPFDIFEIVCIESLIALVLFVLVLWKKTPPANRFQYSYAKGSSFFLVIMVLLISYRLGLTFVDLMSKPVFPWDGWWAWSAKAKVFYYHQSFPILYADVDPFWAASELDIGVTGGKRHPYFVSLIQTYTALAWLGWDDNIVNLPWFLLGVSLVFGAYGGLRYLGMQCEQALFASYLIISTPIFDSHIALGSYADVWVGAAMLFALLFFIISLEYRIWALLYLMFSFCVITFFTKNSSLVFFFVFFVPLMLRLTGYIISLAIIFCACIIVYIVNSFFDMSQNEFLTHILSTGIGNLFIHNHVDGSILKEWLFQDNWHFIFLISFVSVFVLIVQKKHRSVSPFMLLIVSGVSLFLCMVFIAIFTTKMDSMEFVGYFNRITLYFMMIFSLVPISSYFLINSKVR